MKPPQGDVTRECAPVRRPLLRVRDLRVSFSGPGGERVQAVDGAHLSLFPGQTLAVVGESGSGKSVTALSTLGLVSKSSGRVDGGSILFDAGGTDGPIDLLSLDEARMRRIRGNQIAMIFQEPMTSLNPVYTVGDQICEAVRLHQGVHAGQARDTALQAMVDVGIPEPERRIGQYPHQFSGGMRQRVMIAMALVCRPRLLLADEPTTALDVTVQAQILELLRELQSQRGMAIMLITHALGVVAENADVVCVMYGGRVVEYATVTELFDCPMHPYTRGLLASIPKMGARTERLVTIRDIVGSEAEFQRVPGVRPWWPEHTPPPDLDLSQGSVNNYCLHEAAPGHWVGAWRTRSISGLVAREPELAFWMKRTK